MGAVVLVGIEPSLKDLVAGIAGSEDSTFVEENADEASFLGGKYELDLVVLGESIKDPISLAQRAGRRTNKSGVLIIAAPEQAETTEHALRFSPFIAGDVRCVRSDRREEIAELVRSMAAKSQRRRRFSSALNRLREQVPAPSSRDDRSLYLDTLLDYAPVGVIVLDANGTVIDLNPEALRFIDVQDVAARGRKFADVLPPPVRERANEVAEEAKSTEGGSASARMSWSSAEPEMHAEVTAASLSRGDNVTGTMIILRDVTAEVNAARAQWELREQRAVADALEAQSNELRRLNQELEKRNEDLKQFAHVASHDLQEPLRKIASFSDLLMRDLSEKLGEDGRFYVERMQSAALRMSELIRGLLRFSRIQTEQHDVGPVDLNIVLEHVQADLMVSIQESGAKIQVDELPVVAGDEGQLRQLFQNLISNGIKFTKPGEHPRIHVSAEEYAEVEGEDGPALHRISVSDNGIGFEDQYAERIFSPFQRLHSSSNYPGTGMGLAIVSRIAERHGGRVFARSDDENGATFVIELPHAS